MRIIDNDMYYEVLENGNKYVLPKSKTIIITNDDDSKTVLLSNKIIANGKID